MLYHDIRFRSFSISVSAKDCDAKLSVDYETEHWPVPLKFLEKLHAIKYEYMAQPLPVYTENDTFVESRDVVDVLAGALVKIQFELQHYHIGKKNHDSFNATMVQIIVLQPGAPPPTSALKRKNVWEGPVRSNPILLERTGSNDIGQPEAGPSKNNHDSLDTKAAETLAELSTKDVDGERTSVLASTGTLSSAFYEQIC